MAIAGASLLLACTGCGKSDPRNAAGGGDASPSVYQFHNHPNRDGFFVDPAITKATATTFHNDSTFDGTVAGHVYASPLYADGSLCPDGKASVYIATESNNVYRLDDATGLPLAGWPVNVGLPAGNNGSGCGDIAPLGITGTPAIDPATRLIVLDAAIGDNHTTLSHTVFGIDACTGGTPKWSVPLASIKDPNGATFDPVPQNQRSAALIVGRNAYFAFGGHNGDCGMYHGWVMAVPLDGTTANARAFRTDSDQSGIWGPGGPSSDGQSVFVTTGNITDRTGGTSWAGSESVIRLGLDMSFTKSPADYYAPANWHDLDNNDTDLSGSGPLVLDAPAIQPSALVMAQGKDGNLYLLDRANLGGVGARTVGTLHALNGEISNAAAFATIGGTTYVVVRPNGPGTGAGCPNGTHGELVAVRLDPSSPQKMAVAWCASSGGRGNPIITSSDGINDALVWIAGAEGDNELHAFDLSTGATIFAGGKIPNIRHLSSSIIAARGRIFAAGDGAVYALTH